MPTVKPRMRAGKSYPGGKFLRKAQMKLAARRQGCEAVRADIRKRPKTIPESAFTMPGSMTK